MQVINKSILSLDVGSKRIGIAIASLQTRLPRPLVTVDRDSSFYDYLQKLIETEHVALIVIGLPRGLQGQTTQQTDAIYQFSKEFQRQISIPIQFQDEALTSVQAETELQARHKTYDRKAIDALAATYILDDFLQSHNKIEERL